VTVSETFGAKLVFTWNAGCIQGNILSSYEVPLAPPSFQELMISLDAKSPVPLNVAFDIAVTISNLGNKSRNLTLMMGSLPGVRKKKVLRRRSSSSLIKNASELLKISSANSTGDEEILANDEEESTQPIRKHRGALEIFEDKISDVPAVICCDKTLHLGKVKPNSTVTANLRVLAVREGLYELEPIMVHDETSQTTYTAADTFQLYVQDVSKE